MFLNFYTGCFYCYQWGVSDQSSLTATTGTVTGGKSRSFFRSINCRHHGSVQLPGSVTVTRPDFFTSIITVYLQYSITII